MASLRTDRTKADGTPYASVLYRHNGKQRSISFEGDTMIADAEYAKELFNSHGPARALEILDIQRDDTPPGPSVEQWLNHYIDNLTGVEQKTIDDYRRYIRRDIAPILGDLPLALLAEEDIARWVRTLETTGGRSSTGQSAKTIRNKHGFLSAALSKAVPKHISANPAAGRRLPKGNADTDDHEPVFLSRDDFAVLLKAVTEPWRPMVRFMVASGCRWGEVTALKPRDIDIQTGTVRIRRAWKYSTTKGYYIGRPKTKRSRRQINVAAKVLAELNLTGEWVFTNSGRGQGQFRGGVTRPGKGPVRYPNFYSNVWVPAVDRSGLVERPTPHDLRHTCASWMIAKGQPLPVISRHLGHESIQVTVDIYGHLDRSTSEAAADAIGAMLD